MSSSRGRDADRSTPPARIRTYRFPIFGSCRRSAAKARRRLRMHKDSGRDPTRRVAFHAFPRHRRSLTTAIEPLIPAADHLMAKRVERGTVEGHPEIIEVALNGRMNVATLFWNRLMPSTLKFLTNGLQLLQHPLAHRFPNHRELSLPRLSAGVRESKKVECLRLPSIASPP